MISLAFTAVLLPLISAYVNNSAEYRDGSMGPYPSQTYETHPGDFPIFNFDPFPSITPPEPPGYLLLAPRGDNVTTQGALILDWSGGLVWDGTEYGQTMTFNVQTYMGNQVLALWTGDFQLNGWGRGRVLLLDQQYQVVANISTTLADQGQSIDFHEAQVTSNDTALVLVYNQIDDLISGVVQELNISTGEALFTWDSIDHVPTEDCYVARGDDGSPWDYIHLNSIDKDALGNYLISSRHCSSLFYVAPDGTILWRVGGRYSNFTGSSFAWQHDARWRGPNTISLFDNAANTWTVTGDTAQGVILELDFETMSITQTNFTAPTGETSASQGSFQKLYDADGGDEGWLAGWGNRPYLTEFAPDGSVRWHAQFGTTTQSSYRAVKAQWQGYPTTNPSISVSQQGNDLEVLVSWSGATEVGYWLLLADDEEVGRIEHGAFQDRMTVAQSAVQGRNALQVAGYTTAGGALGWSDRWLLAENTSEAVPVSEQNRTEGTATFAPMSTTAMPASTGASPATTSAGGSPGSTPSAVSSAGAATSRREPAGPGLLAWVTLAVRLVGAMFVL